MNDLLATKGAKGTKENLLQDFCFEPYVPFCGK